jgi:putative transposase
MQADELKAVRCAAPDLARWSFRGIIAAKTLDERQHLCDCGADIHRDVAAAMVVHFRAFSFWPGSGLGSLSEPVAA